MHGTVLESLESAVTKLDSSITTYYEPLRKGWPKVGLLEVTDRSIFTTVWDMGRISLRAINVCVRYKYEVDDEGVTVGSHTQVARQVTPSTEEGRSARHPTYYT
jgi:hypothetical protein